MGPGPAALIERAEEIVVIDAAISSALSGHGQVVLVEGAPGLGKTSLLQTAAGAAEDAGMRVLDASGAMLEQDLAWAVVRDVFQAQVELGGTDAPLLGGAAAACSGLFTGERELEPVPDAAARVLHGLYWLTSNLLVERPLMIVIDDLHWVDLPSQRWLAHLAARSRDLTLCLVIAVRDIHQTAVAGSIATEPHTTIRPLAGFSGEGTAALLADQLGGLEQEAVDRCHQLTGGNPFLLCELIRELRSADARSADARSAQAVARLRPVSVRTSVLVRLSELGDTATLVARAVAILGQQTTLPTITELLDLDLEEVVRALDALAAVGILNGLETPLRFQHPLILEVIRAELSASERVLLHRRAAELLERRGAPLAVLAAHLLATEPDERPQVVATLRAAADQAIAQGAPEAGVAYLRRALEEPPPAAKRVGVLWELGRAEGMLASGQGVERLRDAFAGAAGPRLRAEIAIELAGQLLTIGGLAEAADVCRSAIGTLGQGDRELRFELLVHLAQADTQDLTVTNGASQGVDPAELSGATRGERLLLAVLANLGVTQPSPDLPALAEMASRANAGDTLLQDITADGTLYWAALTTLAFGDRYEEAEARLLAAEKDSRARGSSRGLGLCGAFGSPVLYRMGRLAQAEQGALRALELFADEPLMASYARSFLIDSLIDQGKLDDARQALAGVVLEGHPPLLCFALLRLTAARVLASEGEVAAAAGQLLEVGAELGATSSVVWPWRVEAALALHQAGAAEHALELATEAVAEAREVRSAWLLARGLHALGITSDQLEPLREAVTRSPARIRSCWSGRAAASNWARRSVVMVRAPRRANICGRRSTWPTVSRQRRWRSAPRTSCGCSARARAGVV